MIHKHFKTKAKFNEELAKNPSGISDSDICFIKDTGEIWTHGKFYAGSDALSERISSIENGDMYELPEGGIPKSDLSSEVQAALTAAGTAIQSHQDISGKADKVSGAVSGNFASLNSSGNLVDSGVAVGDLASSSHTHTKSDITDFTHSHTKSDISDFAHTHTKSDITGLPTKLSQLTDDLGSNPTHTHSGKADKDTDAVAGNVAEFDSNGNPVDSGIASSNVAEQDGYYEGLRAGLSDNVIGEFSESSAEISFRPTAGAVDIESGKADKGAKITGIKGNTRAWNQMIDNADKNFRVSVGATMTDTGDAFKFIASSSSMTFQNGGLITYPISNHKYYRNFTGRASKADVSLTTQVCGKNTYFTLNTNYASYSSVDDAGTILPYNLIFYFVVYNNIVGDWIEIKKNMMVIDLTLIYGSGNEPETAAEFEADYQRWFGKPLTYEAYDAGSLRSVEMTGIKTVGFNAWDEEWENGAISTTGSLIEEDPTRIRPKNFIEVIPNTTYCLSVKSKPSGITYVMFYSNNESASIISYAYLGSKRTFTTPSNCRYIKFSFENNVYGNTYLHDINLNLSHSGVKNSEYEPYWTSMLNVPITTFKGKLNGEGSSVVVFPDGLKKAGTVYDEIVRRGNKTYAIKRIGAVDLGTLEWHGQDGSFYSETFSGLDSFRIVCSSYPRYGNDHYITGIQNADYVIGVNKYSSSGYYPKDAFVIKDSSHATAPTSQDNWLSGVMLYYELETPKEYLLDDFELPQEYDVDDYGTEEVQLGTNGCAPVLDIKYGINAGDTIKNLPHSYVSAVGEQSFTEAQKARARRNIKAAALDDNGQIVESQLQGEYPALTAGNIVGDFFDTGAEFAYRPSAGSVSIGSGKADEGAKILGIKGNTVVWNQLMRPLNSTYWSASNNNTVTVTFYSTYVHCQSKLNVSNVTPSDTFGIHTISYSNDVPLIPNHKYYTSIDYKGTIAIYFKAITYGINPAFRGVTGTTTWRHLTGIYTVPSNWGGIGESYVLSFYQDVSFTTSDYFDIKNFNLIDLTLIYGAGNEPSTPEAFEADYQRWFGKPLTYEEYDAGSLRPVKMTGLKTTGFNQWDEEWEIVSNYFQTKNYIHIVPDYSLYVKFGGEGINHDLLFYDNDKNPLGINYTNNDRIYTNIPNDCSFVKIRNSSDTPYGNTYNHDICINLHNSGTRDGEYEPYWESTLPIPITTLTGKLNGEGDDVVVFPDGLKKAGTVYDEIVRRGHQTWAIKRVGSADLGNIQWIYYPSMFNYVFFGMNGELPGYKFPTNSDLRVNYECNRYLTNVANPNPGDKTLVLWGAFNAPQFRIIDSAHDTAPTEQNNWMSGVILYYELATPEEYLLDDFELPETYDVDDWGTEEILLGENGCAPVLDLEYGINAPETLASLPHNYVSITNRQVLTDGEKGVARHNIDAASRYDVLRLQSEIDRINHKEESEYWVDLGLPSGRLWAKRNIDVTQPDGFAVSPYQYECSFFSWGNTIGHNPISTTAFQYNFGNSNSGPYASTPGAALTGDIGLSYDAAHVNLGGDWRMPTVSEVTELLAGTKYIDANGDDIASETADKRITFNGVVGIRLKSTTNGKEIFFPCAGNGYTTNLAAIGSAGRYWTSTYASSSDGRDLVIDTSHVTTYSNARYLGFSIRPVL